MSRKRSLRSDQQLLVGAALLSLALWFVPFGYYAVLPLLFLNTHVHELFHALGAIGTGGSAEHILVFGDGSGVTPVRGGNLLVVGSAGYVGASILGAFFIWLGRTQKGAQGVFWLMTVVLGIGLILWVRGDGVGLLSGWFWLGVCLSLALWVRGKPIVFAAQFLGVQLCLASFQSIFILYRLSMYAEGQSDATIMQDATGIPAVVWAGGWILFSLLVAGLTLKAAWRDAPRRRASAS